MPWLHGTLYATILEAKDLPDDKNTGLNLKIPGAKSGLGSKLMKGLKSVDEAVGEPLQTMPSCAAASSVACRHTAVMAGISCIDCCTCSGPNEC
jgi:hypothetical protein